MYVFLLVLGAVASLAGMSLVASGVNHQSDIQASLITSGAIAFVGGLIIIALGLAVKVLQRIERAIARPAQRVVRAQEVAVAVEPEPASPPARIPFPPKPKSEPRPQSAPAAAQTPAENGSLDHVREKFPTLVRLESAPVVEDADVSLLPPAVSNKEFAQVSNGHAHSAIPAHVQVDAQAQIQAPARVQAPAQMRAQARGQVNGSAPAKTATRLDVNSRPSGPSERRKASMFESLWPKGARVGRDAQSVVVQMPAPAPPELRAEPAPESQPAPVKLQAPTPVSILKSGVVDGMAYTLYSDGSIEAQLSQGILRFGSITELRNHIEQSS